MNSFRNHLLVPRRRSGAVLNRDWEEVTALTLTLSPGRGNATAAFVNPARCSAFDAVVHAAVALGWSGRSPALPLLGGEGRGEGELVMLRHD